MLPLVRLGRDGRRNLSEQKTVPGWIHGTEFEWASKFSVLPDRSRADISTVNMLKIYLEELLSRRQLVSQHVLLELRSRAARSDDGLIEIPLKGDRNGWDS
jgi:hypothetical protein